MIQSKADYMEYVHADETALNMHKMPLYIKEFNPIWKFQRSLRYCEYATNR